MAQSTPSGSWPTTIVVAAEVYDHLRAVHQGDSFCPQLRGVMGEIVRMLRQNPSVIGSVIAISKGGGLRHASLVNAKARTRMTMNIATAMVSEITALVDARSVGVVMRAAMFVLYERDAVLAAENNEKRAVS